MPDSHASTVRQATQSNNALAVLFGKLGTAEHPRGAILSLYRQIRREMRRGNVGALDDLRAALESIIRDFVQRAARLGQEQAVETMEAYSLPPAVRVPDTTPMVQSWLTTVDQQVQQARMYVAMDDMGAILGDGQTRLGVLQPAPMVREGARVLTATLANTLQNHYLAVPDPDYRQQAVAVIDERTTDCCLRVHGQVQPLDQPFELTGTPRFADKLAAPPFHWYCRSAVALVHIDEIDDELTDEMREASRLELEARAKAQARQDELEAQLVKLGAEPDVRIRKDDTDRIKNLRRELRSWRERERVEIHPANARSRRGT